MFAPASLFLKKQEIGHQEGISEHKGQTPVPVVNFSGLLELLCLVLCASTALSQAHLLFSYNLLSGVLLDIQAIVCACFSL